MKNSIYITTALILSATAQAATPRSVFDGEKSKGALKAVTFDNLDTDLDSDNRSLALNPYGTSRDSFPQPACTVVGRADSFVRNSEFYQKDDSGRLLLKKGTELTLEYGSIYSTWDDSMDVLLFMSIKGGKAGVPSDDLSFNCKFVSKRSEEAAIAEINRRVQKFLKFEITNP